MIEADILELHSLEDDTILEPGEDTSDEDGMTDGTDLLFSDRWYSPKPSAYAEMLYK